jgi:hypothetical protein
MAVKVENSGPLFARPGERLGMLEPGPGRLLGMTVPEQVVVVGRGDRTIQPPDRLDRLRPLRGERADARPEPAPVFAPTEFRLHLGSDREHLVEISAREALPRAISPAGRETVEMRLAPGNPVLQQPGPRGALRPAGRRDRNPRTHDHQNIALCDHSAKRFDQIHIGHHRLPAESRNPGNAIGIRRKTEDREESATLLRQDPKKRSCRTAS